jgi:hypothetical protein
MTRIRIREKQPVPLRGRHSDRQRIILSGPSRWQFTGVQHFQRQSAHRNLAQNRPGPVRRMIVNNNDFANLRLRRERLNRARNRNLFISCRDDGGEQGFYESPSRRDLLDYGVWILCLLIITVFG